MLSQDSEDEIRSRFAFELAIWLWQDELNPRVRCDFGNVYYQWWKWYHLLWLLFSSLPISLLANVLFGHGENCRSLGDNLESLKSHQALKSNCIHGEYQLYFLCCTMYMTIGYIWTAKLKIISIALCVFVGHLDHPKGKLCSECYKIKTFWTLILPKCQKYSGKSTTSERKSS